MPFRSLPPPIAIVNIVDSDEVASLLMPLRAAFTKVQSFPSAESFLANSSCDSVGCLIVADELKGMSGRQLIADMTAAEFCLTTILTTSRGTFQLAVEAFRVGAFDVFERPVACGSFIKRVSAAMSSSVTLHKSIRAKRYSAAKFASLSVREREVIKLVVSGKLNKVVAFDLGISEKTVETHRARAMQKLGVDNSIALARLMLTLSHFQS